MAPMKHPVGWVCPRCGKVNAPTVRNCTCPPIIPDLPRNPAPITGSAMRLAESAFQLAGGLFGVPPDMDPAVIRSTIKSRRICNARHVASWMLRHVCGWTFEEIATITAKCRKAVQHSCAMTEDMAETVPGFAHRLEEVRRQFEASWKKGDKCAA